MNNITAAAAENPYMQFVMNLQSQRTVQRGNTTIIPMVSAAAPEERLAGSTKTSMFDQSQKFVDIIKQQLPIKHEKYAEVKISPLSPANDATRWISKQGFPCERLSHIYIPSFLLKDVFSIFLHLPRIISIDVEDINPGELTVIAKKFPQLQRLQVSSLHISTIAPFKDHRYLHEVTLCCKNMDSLGDLDSGFLPLKTLKMSIDMKSSGPYKKIAQSMTTKKNWNVLRFS